MEPRRPAVPKPGTSGSNSIGSSALGPAAAPAERERRARMPRWLALLGRAGYASKGVVYCLVGALAVAAAAGEGGSVGGGRNAIAALGRQPFGQVLLALVALGLACYVSWRIAQAIRDPDGQGTDASGIAKRATYVASGLAHLGLAVFAVSLALGGRSARAARDAGSGGGATDWTATLMQQPFGLWLLGAVGVLVAGFGLRQFERAYRASFMDRYRAGEMNPRERELARRLGRFGLSARGAVFCMIGVFVVRAALRADPSQTRGLGGALSTLFAQPYGAWLLGVVALGLVAYGLFCFSYARHRDFRRS